MSIKYLDMYSGIGGFRSALDEIGGFECVGYCEIDKFAKQAYETLYDTKGEMYFEDARNICPDDLPDIDLICAGFPCQSFSLAGKQRGFDDTRGTLFFEVARVAAAKRPALLYLENVQNLLSHDKGWTFETILEVLDDIGYDVSWTVLNSANFGVPQSRNRVFITGFLRGRCAGEIFAFSQANPKTLKQRLPGREGNRVYDSNGLAITLTSSAGGFGGRTGLYILPIKSKTKIGYQFAHSGDSINTAYANNNTRRGRVGEGIAHTETTTATLAVYLIDMNPSPQLTELARCITARQDSGISNRKGEHSAVLVIVKEITPDETKELNGIKAEESNTDKTAGVIILSDEEDNQYIAYIRKLTPKECWRLQGFTDEQFNKVKAIGMSDSQLYKMAGNAVTVPAVFAISRELKRIFYGGVK
ncbi:MAG TPA: DNA cytosine methyltransferase [Candidatus Eubacterium faecigallinarum]|nr:DNA cytosine methyltransferase [Candidatus Eubacterium faecigallinarum]